MHPGRGRGERTETIDDDDGETAVGAAEEVEHLGETAGARRLVVGIEEGGGDLVAMARAEVEEGLVLLADASLLAVRRAPSAK